MNRCFKRTASASGLVLCGLLLAGAGSHVSAAEAAAAVQGKWPSAPIPKKAPFQLGEIHESPVLTRGEAGAWDSVDLLNPSVIYFKDQFINYYSGFDGKTWRTGIATSKFARTWEKYKNNPVLEPREGDWDVSYISANGAAVVFGDKVYYCYQGKDKDGVTRIGLAISTDGFHFTKHAAPVLDLGAQDTWDSHVVADPYLVVREGQLYLYYLGQDSQEVQRLGVARSADGITWERFPGNPILDVGGEGSFDENGLGEPSVVFQAPHYYLLYTGRDSQENRNLGYAISADGTHWKKITGAAGLISEHKRAEWFSKVICDTTLLPEGDGRWRVWFGGGTSAQPAENLEGQVGVLLLDLSAGFDGSGFDAETDWSKTDIKSNEFLRGSHEIEGDMGSRSTWVGKHASVTLKLNPSLENKDLVFEGWAPAELIAAKTKQEGEQTITLSVNGVLLSSKTFDKDDTFTMRVPWKTLAPLIADKQTLEVEIKSSRCFVPAQIADSKDTRELALMIRRIVFRSPLPAAR